MTKQSNSSSHQSSFLQLDLNANTATGADWIRHCRRAGLYEHVRALYEKGGFTFDSLGEEAQMEVEEDYQVCVRRSYKGCSQLVF